MMVAPGASPEFTSPSSKALKGRHKNAANKCLSPLPGLCYMQYPNRRLAPPATISWPFQGIPKAMTPGSATASAARPHRSWDYDQRPAGRPPLHAISDAIILDSEIIAV
jgi:hypothetical protein